MMKRFLGSLRLVGIRVLVWLRAAGAAVLLGLLEVFSTQKGRRLLAVLGMAGVIGLVVWKPPVGSVAPGEVGVRVNRLTGGVTLLSPGPTLKLPGVHELR
ncbi:MAG TPA: hypothetical protein VF518_00175, partial [Polyangia bacterium]